MKTENLFMYHEDFMAMVCVGCGKPAEEHQMVLKSKCHLKGLEVSFDAGSQSLYIACFVCHTPVCRPIKIARKPVS